MASLVQAIESFVKTPKFGATAFRGDHIGLFLKGGIEVCVFYVNVSQLEVMKSYDAKN
jgi:hypothetical protein